jgi:hypothetical protein
LYRHHAAGAAVFGIGRCPRQIGLDLALHGGPDHLSTKDAVGRTGMMRCLSMRSYVNVLIVAVIVLAAVSAVSGQDVDKAEAKRQSI